MESSPVEDLDLNMHFHAGMYRLAKELWDRIKNIFIDAEDEVHDILITGHSLGAGVASILSILMDKELNENWNIKCIAYATPACVREVDLKHIKENRPKIVSFVNQLDIVPCLSLPAVEFLASVLVGEKKLKDSFERIMVPPGKILHCFNKSVYVASNVEVAKSLIPKIPYCFLDHFLENYEDRIIKLLQNLKKVED